MSIAFISQKHDNEIDALLQNFKLGGCLFQLTDGYIEQIIHEFLVIKVIQDILNKKQLVKVLSFLGSQSFLATKQLQSCLKYPLPYSSLRVFFLFCFKEISPHLANNFICSFWYTTCYGKLERHFLVVALNTLVRHL